MLQVEGLVEGGAFVLDVKISGSFWKGAEMALKNHPGTDLLRYCYPFAGGQNPDFPIAAFGLPHAASRKSGHVLVG